MVTVCMVLCSQGPTQLFVVSSTASQQTGGWVPGECCSYLTRLRYDQVWCCIHIHCLVKGLPLWAYVGMQDVDLLLKMMLLLKN